MKVRGGLLVALCLVFTCAPVLAQEGHPLRGTWIGDWGPSASHRNQVTLILDWDGDNVTGVVNPGPDSIPIDAVTLDPVSWTVHIEVEARDRDGGSVQYVIDGQIENLGLRNRTLSGSWKHGDVTGDFTVTRQ